MLSVIFIDHLLFGRSVLMPPASRSPGEPGETARATMPQTGTMYTMAGEAPDLIGRQKIPTTNKATTRAVSPSLPFRVRVR